MLESIASERSDSFIKEKDDYEQSANVTDRRELATCHGQCRGWISGSVSVA